MPYDIDYDRSDAYFDDDSDDGDIDSGVRAKPEIPDWLYYAKHGATNITPDYSEF